MKIPKEYSLLGILTLFLVSYLLENTVSPISLRLSSPYAFFQNGDYLKYPFSTAVIFIRSLGIFLTPIWLLSFIKQAFGFKFISLFIATLLIQLYALQTVTTYSSGIPLEWSLSLSCGSIFWILPLLIYLLSYLFVKLPPVKSADIGSLTDTDDDWSQED